MNTSVPTVGDTDIGKDTDTGKDTDIEKDTNIGKDTDIGKDTGLCDQAQRHLFCAVLRLASKVLQHLTPKVVIPTAGGIPKPHAVLYQAAVIPCCHVHLHESSHWTQ